MFLLWGSDRFVGESTDLLLDSTLLSTFSQQSQSRPKNGVLAIEQGVVTTHVTHIGSRAARSSAQP